MLRKLLLVFSALLFLGCLALGIGATWGYYYFTRDLPHLSSIDDYQPPAVSEVYSSDGTLIAEFFKERRYPVKLQEIPEVVRNCFLAAEDSNFYEHPGIDPISILRAFVKNLQAGEVKQGGSTITQQVVKNLLLSTERKYERKIKEAILSYRLEQRLTKDEILEMYLNQIFFGNTAYGIKAASKMYFHKEPKDLTLAEGAMLAGLPKAPSRYSPLVNFERAKRRQRYVLNRMVQSKFVSRQDADQAVNQELKLYRATNENIYHAPYFVTELRRYFGERWREIDIDTAGLKVFTSLDLRADALAEKAVRAGLREVDKRRGWRGPLQHLSQAPLEEAFRQSYSSTEDKQLEFDTVYPALVTKIDSSSGQAWVDLGNFTGKLNLRDAVWSRRLLDPQDRVSWIKPESLVRSGDVIEVSIPRKEKSAAQIVGQDQKLEGLVLDQTPQIEGALVLLDPQSGRVVSMVGGYSYQHSKFNRATQSYRQPGSAFKPVVYLTAVEQFKYTPATIVYDTQRTFRIGDDYWTPGNFDGKFLGPITLRTALQRSRNLVSADIISRIGVDPVINYAHKLGITSKLGRNLSLSLGSSEVTVLELTRAYGVFAAGGVLFDTTYVDKLVARDGVVIYDYNSERLSSAKQVIGQDAAFIMANMMKGVVENGTGYRVKVLNRPIAAKTGTSNDQMDAWFIGYTPEWVCGVWVGFDVKKEIGSQETGGRVAAPIWLYLMDPFLKEKDQEKYNQLVQEAKDESERLGIEYVAPHDVQPLDFSVPEGVDPFWVDKETGLRSEPNAPGAIYEYFIRGTEPEDSIGQEDLSSYLESSEL